MDLWKCQRCNRLIDYVRMGDRAPRYPGTQNIPPRVEAVHLPLFPGEVSVTHSISDSTKRLARYELGNSLNHCPRKPGLDRVNRH